MLDGGHLSQTLHLSAIELGRGAFVTSAFNEVDIERAFGLDPLVDGPLAICCFGWAMTGWTMSSSIRPARSGKRKWALRASRDMAMHRVGVSAANAEWGRRRR